jgi:hypothetical protein
MKFCARIAGCILLAGILLMGTGCRYLTNRYYDFRDLTAIGAGVTAENKITGTIPPSLGAYVEVTDLLHFGAISFNGLVAESDLRGSFCGPESSTRFGLLWWQMIRKTQDYENGHINAFKNREFPWCQRMESISMSNGNAKPAKCLHYDPWANYMTHGSWMLHRGWQYWEYTGAEVAICDPLLTHFGFMFRFGIDISECSDFVLGWVGIDYKNDDMTADEYVVFRDKPDKWGLKLVPVRPRRQNMPATDEGAEDSQGADENAGAPEAAK